MMETPEEKDNRIFLERGDGLGWTLNFDNKWSYVILVLSLAAIGCVIWWVSNTK